MAGPGVALVTGAAKRIGRAIACDLARQGYAVVLHYHTAAAAAEAVADEIRAAGGKALALAADLADPRAIESLGEKAGRAFGPVGVLVNNASLFEEDTAEDVDFSLFHRHLTINLMAPCLLAQKMAADLPKDGEGVVINLIDQRVWRLTPRFFSYTLSKAALWTATQTLAQTFAPRIRVMAIGPGPTLASPRQREADFLRQVHAVPLQRGPGLEEITQAVAFILATPSLTGQMLALDGGQHLAWQTPDVLAAKE